MADSSYQRLQAVDVETTIGDTHDVDIGTCHDPTQSAHTPSSNSDDPLAGATHQVPCGSELTTPASISVYEGHPAYKPGVLQHDTPLLSGAETSGPSTSQEQTRQDDLETGFQKRALDQSTELERPRWTMFYFRLPFLLSFSTLLILILTGLEFYIIFRNTTRD